MSAEMDSESPAPVQRIRTRRRRRARFELGRVLGTGVSIWLGGLPAFLTLTVVVFAPYSLLRWWVEVEDPELAYSLVYISGIQLLQQLLSLIVSATVIYTVFQRLRGRRVGMAESVSYGLGRLPAVVGVSLLVALLLVMICLPAAVLWGLGMYVGAGLLAVPTVGFVAIAQCGLWVAVPACVVERPGLLRSLVRSWELTKGSKWAILVLLLLFVFVGFVLGLITSLLVSAITDGRSVWAQLLSSLALAVVMTSLTAVVTAVGYHELRRAVDGIDSNELAAIFD